MHLNKLSLTLITLLAITIRTGDAVAQSYTIENSSAPSLLVDDPSHPSFASKDGGNIVGYDVNGEHLLIHDAFRTTEEVQHFPLALKDATPLAVSQNGTVVFSTIEKDSKLNSIGCQLMIYKSSGVVVNGPHFESAEGCSISKAFINTIDHIAFVLEDRSNGVTTHAIYNFSELTLQFIWQNQPSEQLVSLAYSDTNVAVFTVRNTTTGALSHLLSVAAAALRAIPIPKTIPKDAYISDVSVHGHLLLTVPGNKSYLLVIANGKVSNLNLSATSVTNDGVPFGRDSVFPTLKQGIGVECLFPPKANINRLIILGFNVLDEIVALSVPPFGNTGRLVLLEPKSEDLPKNFCSGNGMLSVKLSGSCSTQYEESGASSFALSAAALETSSPTLQCKASVSIPRSQTSTKLIVERKDSKRSIATNKKSVGSYQFTIQDGCNFNIRTIPSSSKVRPSVFRFLCAQ